MEVTHSNFLLFSLGFLILILICRRLEDLNLVVRDIVQDLIFALFIKFFGITRVRLTLCLKLAISSSVKVSALAMMGMRLTLVCRRRMNSISICLSLSKDSDKIQIVFYEINELTSDPWVG